MEQELKEITNEELIRLYRLVLEHQEYLENEKEKLGEDKND